MALVAGNHETGVTMPIGDLDVGVVLDEKLDDVDVAVKAGSAQRRRVRLGRRVNVSSFANEILDDLEVAGGGRAPQRWRALYILAFEVDEARLFEAGAAMLHDVLDDVVVAIAARHDERRGAVVLVLDDALAVLLAASVQVLLELTRFARLGQLKDDLVRLHVLGEARKGRCQVAHSCLLSFSLSLFFPFFVVGLFVTKKIVARLFRFSSS